jgi:XTP/dITP diphosphohydrolase
VNRGLTLVVASGNRHKVQEIAQVLESLPVNLVSLADFPGLVLPPEDGDTFLANARIKAVAAATHTGHWALADDSGLVVPYLGGRPGIHSARFAGEKATDTDNNRRLLAEMSGAMGKERDAAFVCALVLASAAGETWSFAGRCAGRIAEKARGERGFGYDPVFLLAPDYARSMAEIEPGEKQRFSHRGQALMAFRAWFAVRLG